MAPVAIAVADLYVGMGNIATFKDGKQVMVSGQNAEQVEYAVYDADGERTFVWLDKADIVAVNDHPLEVLA